MGALLKKGSKEGVMKNFCKENAVLILGAILPLLLVGFVLLLRGVSMYTTEQPQHPALFFGSGAQFFQAEIDDAQKLTLSFNAPAGRENMAYPRVKNLKRTLYLYTPITGNLQTFKVKSPTQITPGKTHQLPVPPALAAMRFSSRHTAPDGYRMERTSSRRSGFFINMFISSGRTTNAPALVKDEHVHKLPRLDGYFSRRYFIGWGLKNADTK